jgi:hypothetical protein
MERFFNDDLTIAVSSGICATLIKNCASVLLKLLGIKHYVYWQLAASVFLDESQSWEAAGLLIGFLADLAVASLLGIIFFYVFRFTGRQHHWAKAAMGGFFIWLGITGLAPNLGISKITLGDHSTALAFLITDTLFSYLVVYFILRFGKEYLPEQRYPGREV